MATADAAARAAAAHATGGSARCCSKQWCSDVVITTDRGDETFGWLLLRFGRGPFIIVGGLFIGPVILELAEAAGEANGTGKVMGGAVNASSILVTFATIGGAIAAAMAPVIGAVCDYTRHRKLLLQITQPVAVPRNTYADCNESAAFAQLRPGFSLSLRVCATF